MSLKKFMRAAEVASEILTPLALEIRDGRNGYSDHLSNSMQEGSIPDAHDSIFLCEFFAKKKGESGSDEYGDEFDRIHALIVEASNRKFRIQKGAEL